MKAKDYAYIKRTGHYKDLLLCGLNPTDLHLLYALNECVASFNTMCNNIAISEKEKERRYAQYWRRLAKYFNMRIDEAKMLFLIDEQAEKDPLRMYTGVVLCQKLPYHE